MVTFTLDATELVYAACCGARRQLAALHRARPDAHGVNARNGWAFHIEGAMAEYAVSRYLGMPWEPLAHDGDVRLPAADIGTFIQVRSTPWRPWDEPHLVIRQKDNPSHLYYLVCVSIPRFHIVGKIYGADGMREEYWQNGGRPAWLVPTRALIPCNAR